MRHRKRGRTLGRSPSHRKAMLRNLASSLFLTRQEADDLLDTNQAKVKGRIVTTLQKAKEVRPLVEKCITIARDSLKHEDNAEQFATHAERNTAAWKEWRQSDEWRKWVDARAPVVAARRRVLRMLGNKDAVAVLFDQVAPDFEDRTGGYTRVVRLAKPRLGDAGTRAILEFVGVHDRVIERSEKPAFADDELEEKPAKTSADEPAGEASAAEKAAPVESAEEMANEPNAGEAEKPAE